MHVGDSGGSSRRGTRNRRRSHANEEIALQITSMADIFTILLVFLLKSYSAGVVGVSPDKDTKLPVARGGDQAVEALKVEVSGGSLLLEGKPIAKLNQYEFARNDIREGGTSHALTEALRAERKRQLYIAQENPDVKPDARIMILADQNTPYDTLKTVLASAAVHGYTDFKLVVVQDE